MRNGTLPAMAGNPPADAAHPSGMNGMIVTVPRNAPQEPRAPRILSRLYQNPRNKSTADDHSDTPRNQLAPPDAEHGVHPGNQRAVADIGNQHLRLVREPLLVAEEQEEKDHRCANQVVVEVLVEEAELGQGADEPVHGLGALLVALRRRASSSGSRHNDGARTRASRKHADDDKPSYAANQSVDQSIEPARITRQVQRHHQNGGDGPPEGNHRSATQQDGD